MEIPRHIWLGIDVEVKKERAKHECQASRTCCCSIIALEPNEDCPIHGYPWPTRCEICGRFMKWEKKMAKTLYFFESRLLPGKWCETTEHNFKMWADQGYKIKKVVYDEPPKLKNFDPGPTAPIGNEYD